MLRGDPLLRTVIGGKMEGKRTRGIPIPMMLYWMKTDGKLEEQAQRSEEEGRRRTFEPG